MRKMMSAMLVVLFCAATCGAESVTVIRPVASRISVIDLMREGKTDTHLAQGKPDLNDSPEDIFKLYDGMLYINGRGWGYMATKEAFGDYHLVLDFKWGPNTWGTRKTRARDNGILVHAFGPHGACGNSWITSVEANIIEGGMGDIIVIASSPLPDGTVLRPSVTCEIELDRDKEKRWKRGAPRQTVKGGRVNWEKRCEDWADTLGYRGKDDLDAPVGGWNRLEVIAKNDTLQYIFNGHVVNEAFDVKPSEGKVCIQTEGADMFVRRFELWPLGQFKEKWPPADGQ